MHIISFDIFKYRYVSMESKNNVLLLQQFVKFTKYNDTGSITFYGKKNPLTL